MSKNVLTTAILALVLGGCASVPMESVEQSMDAKQFNPPPANKAGLYIYRDSSFGAALKKDIWVDGRCVGESAPNTFFYEVVGGDVAHTISTESEFSPNNLAINTDAGKNYFVRQYIKFGVFVGGAGLELMDTEAGMNAVSKLELAKSGTCSK
ncbi:MAG: DUF2846 domain-containing protein [Chromatiaceae bacterium]|nr:DUF2846 domain-containing protein [Chromatiaceae bacterium]MCP5421733.1 DUF2846 domain-containing protein [Chromatiaceae bacterium]